MGMKKSTLNFCVNRFYFTWLDSRWNILPNLFCHFFGPNCWREADQNCIRTSQVNWKSSRIPGKETIRQNSLGEITKDSHLLRVQDLSCRTLFGTSSITSSYYFILLQHRMWSQPMVQQNLNGAAYEGERHHFYGLGVEIDKYAYCQARWDSRDVIFPKFKRSTSSNFYFSPWHIFGGLDWGLVQSKW